ncbi:breast cancer type 1 susceptibility protein [Porphyrio hochstetteri]
MDFSVAAAGDVQKVLSAMQKSLECPICLDTLKEPVSTRCDHVFCRFCMSKLLSKKKRGVTECPLCKTEVTKRSLKENSRFKQLIEGLLETIHAFELDTGVKFLSSYHLPKPSIEASAPELSCKENSVVQSKGFRNRKKSTREDGQENCTLEVTVDPQPPGSRVRRCSQRNKPQKRVSGKGVYIELGSDSSEELFKQASNTGLEDKEVLPISSLKKLEEPKRAEKWNESSCNAQPDQLGAKERIQPKVIGESDPSEEGLSKRSTQSSTECAQPGQGDVTEQPSSPSDVLPVDLLAEQCDRRGSASPLRSGDTPFFNGTEETDAEQAQYNSEHKEFDLKDSSESRLNKSKGIDTVVQSEEAVEVFEPEEDSLCEKELPLEKLLQTETPPCATPNQVSRKRLKRSIQKVNEWFSKSKKILSSSSSQDDSAGTTDASGEGDAGLSDKDSSVSEKTDPMVESMEIAEVQGNKTWSKEAAENIKDKIFGKTYKRERKSNPHIILRDTIPITKKEEVAADKCLNNSSHDGRKRKRKTARVLQPEDFTKKKDPEADGSPSAGAPTTSVNWGLGDAEKGCDESAAVNGSHLSGDREHHKLAEHEEGRGLIQETAAEKVTKKRGSAAKRCRSSTRTMGALQLVVDRNSVSPDAAEPQIDSYPSSEEPQRGVCEQGQVRRSRRLQLLSEELAKEAGKGGVTKGVKKNESDHGGSGSGVQRSVLVHASEGQDLCEPQSALSCKSLADLKGGGLEPKETPTGLKRSSDTAEPRKGLHDPTTSCQRSSCSSFAPDACSQEGEILASPLLQSSSVTAVQTASHPAEEMTEACAAAPQGGGHDMQNVPRDLQTEELPVAKNGSELTKEAEDSEVDTQFLRGIFRHSKRLSFSLYPTPMKGCAAEGAAASETLKRSCADQVENKQSKYLKPEDLQEEKTAAESLSRVCEREKLKGRESACISPVSSFVGTTESVHMKECQRDASGAANQGSLTPVRMGAAGTEDKNRLRNGERGDEKPVSPDMGNELRQSPTDSDDSGTEKQVVLRADLNAVGEACFSSESNQAGKAKAVDGKLHFHSKSMSKRERKQVKGNEEQATQTASIGMPECLVTEALKEPLQENSDSTGLSETVEGLLCSDDDEENTSFSETHRRETSAVFVKRSDNTLVKEPHKKNVSSEQRSQGMGRSRRKAQKLQSSGEESSEEEDLPSFDALIFGTSVRTPLQVDKPVTSVVESSVSPITLPHDGVHDDNNMQKMPEAALSSRDVSPSQESGCSVNLFSSQSDDSVDGSQELKESSLQVPASNQASNGNGRKEASQSSVGGLKRSKANSKNECQEDPNMGTNLGEASGYDSETSNAEDMCGAFSQGEILTTQQKNAMQKNLKKLQKEMAVLEAVLKQHGSQETEFAPVCRKAPPSSGEGTLGMEQRRKEGGAESTSEGKFENHRCSSANGFSDSDFCVTPSDSLNSKMKEIERQVLKPISPLSRSPELVLPSSKSSLLKTPDVEQDLQSSSVPRNKAPSEKTTPVWEARQEYSQCQLEGENEDEQKSGTRLNSASVLSNLSGNVTRSRNNSSSIGLLNPPTAEATNSSVAQNANKRCTQEWKSKRSRCFPVPILHSAAEKENAAGPAVTNRREMSIVASGLNQSEHLVVQKFARKTQSTLSSYITEGTTHVVMKTDKELVCERTLKYFLGIAGRKWVVSYQWILQSFKEGRILDEEDFEVRGDVINGRNHQGPKRARESLTEPIFKGFEICCFGPFTGMTTEHLEWMVELCGASVVKQLHLFSHSTNSTAVVVVQPDAWMENTDYRAIQQNNNVAMVTREWVLDSVACYECQELDAYLLS